LVLIRVPQTLPRPLDPEEITPFVDSLRSHRDRAMVLVMLLAGLRKSEVLKLGLKDIDFGQRTLIVREGKGGHQRVVAISDTGLQEIISYLNKERPASRSDKVFLVMKGKNQGRPLTIASGYHHRVPPAEGRHTRRPVPPHAPHLFHPVAPGRNVAGSPAGAGRTQQYQHHQDISTPLSSGTSRGIPADVR
jgi:integrase